MEGLVFPYSSLCNTCQHASGNIQLSKCLEATKRLHMISSRVLLNS